MSFQDALSQYQAALKAGQKYYKSCTHKGAYPYLPVLDEQLEDSMSAGHESLGVLEIPSDLVIGTKTAGRRNAFAGNFMPLLPQDTEFAAKWISLCTAHLSPEGIHDPVLCFEYLGKFYVQEGNKRVSVLKSFQAPLITAKVIRILPDRSDAPEIRQYYEFLSFYALSRLYSVQLTIPGGYSRLQVGLGFDPEHTWTEEERRSFSSQYYRFRTTAEKLIPASVSCADLLLVWIRTNRFWDLREMTQEELEKSILSALPDMNVLSGASKIDVSTQPEEAKGPSFFSLLMGHTPPTHLNIAFIFTATPETSPWANGHDLGRKYLEEAMGDQITVKSYLTALPEAERTMETAIEEGAQVLFATTPPLISACLKVAARHPNVRILNCSLSMPFTGIRTYYSRIYEAKFIVGAVAGAMCREGSIGYIANYPIYGVIAGINAFALGAQLTCPGVRIKLTWSCLPGDPGEDLQSQQINVVSGQDTISNENRVWGKTWGSYRQMPDGEMQPLTSACWNWGKLYTKMVQSIFHGGWELSASPSVPVSYWWGFSSGVVDVELSHTLPGGVRRLANILKQGIQSGVIDPFRCRIVDQDGIVRNPGDCSFTSEEIVHMDWLCDCVEGRIPEFDELIPQSREIVRLLGIHREQLPPEKEGINL